MTDEEFLELLSRIVHCNMNGEEYEVLIEDGSGRAFKDGKQVDMPDGLLDLAWRNRAAIEELKLKKGDRE